MTNFVTLNDKNFLENEMPFNERFPQKTMYSFLSRTSDRFPDRPALSFQLKSGVKDPAETFTWKELKTCVTKLANFFRSQELDENDVVAYVLPNCNEAVISFLAGACSNVICPINPLLDSDQIASILNEVNAKVVISLCPFPKTDVAQKVNLSLSKVPSVKVLIEVDLKKYLSPPLSWIVSMIRPKIERKHSAKIINFSDVLDTQEGDKLNFEDIQIDKIGAFFHTGGTTGMPKVAKHNISGMIYQGWCTTTVLSSWSEKDSLICPLPMFHVFAVYPMLMTCVASGAHIIFPTPQGYRGEGVFDNFWKLVERWKVSFMVMVPTAATALMQKKVDADVSSLKYAICGSAPLPKDLFNRFEESTGLKILEGYGMTEATCLISVNPPEGKRKVGSVGIPFPYTNLKIMHFDENGGFIKECSSKERGEICISNPGVSKDVYTNENANKKSAYQTFFKTGDLGYIDDDGYVWITGRAKDIIIRGGYNVDPAVIEDLLSSHDEVAMVGAIGQPDIKLGEIPCAYVELITGSKVTSNELIDFLKEKSLDKLAMPSYIEIMNELPKTAVGKIFKPILREYSIKRVFNSELQKNNLNASVEYVKEDKLQGLVAIVKADENVKDEEIDKCLNNFIYSWSRV